MVARFGTTLGAAAAVLAMLSLAGCGGGGASGGSSNATPQSVTAQSAAALGAATYTVPQNAGSVAVTVVRSGSSTAAISVGYDTSDGTAVAGTDYTSTSGTLQWAENDMTAKTLSVPVSNANPFTGSKTFTVALTDPSTSTAIGNPGSAVVSISGDAAEPTVQLGNANFTVMQGAGPLTVTVNRAGSSSGAISVGYHTADGTGIAGTDYSTTAGTLQWADGDAAAKSFSVPISAATAFSGNKTFNIQLSNPNGANLGNPSSAIATITGSGSAPVGSLQLSASSYTVAQAAGSVKISVSRVGGSSGVVSVNYATANGTAIAGTDYTASSGTLQWASGDTASKSFTVAVSNATAFSGNKTFSVALSSPSTGASISNPGSATVSITGSAAAAVGNLQLSASSYGVLQSAGSLTVTVNRTGGSSGAVGVSYATSNGSAVAGTDYTAASGTLSWASGDTAAKTVAVKVSNTTPFSGNKSFTFTLSAASGGAAILSPSSASVSITGSAAAPTPGSVMLSASSLSVAQSAGSLTVTVNRAGGSSGAVSVNYATADGTAVAGTDYTAADGMLSWASGDAASKTFSIPVSNATPFSGSKTLTVTLSGPAGGASLGTPSSASVAITGSVAAPPGATAWVYYNGVLNWGGDWSWQVASINYKDILGAPLSGSFDVAVSNLQSGGWQPYVNSNCQQNLSLCFDTTPYKYLIFSLKPTHANQTWASGFMSSGDTPDGVLISDITQYCSGGANPAVGQWESCKIPLSAWKFTDTTILKFMIQDTTGAATDLWYVDNVGFTAN
jgi:hypothetical protein